MSLQNKILQGKCEEVLKTFPNNYFDSCVTDPPYGISFMNKHWDYDIPTIEQWKEVLRVLKPGGHLLCACGTRTQHRMTVNIEDAGFEIRDVITWHYGSGFPKSLDISKAIDKQSGAEREVVGEVRRWGNAAGKGRAGQYANDYEQTDIGAEKFDPLTAPATDAAKQWEGWGTALKPATEFWTLARKPLSESTVAENVLKHGTGGINIDACRIGETGARNNGSKADENGFSSNEIYGKFKAMDQVDYNMGRFPSNLILDEYMAEELDKQSGILTSGTVNPEGFKGEYTANIYGTYANNQIDPDTVYGDTGGASRFFKIVIGGINDFFTYIYSFIKNEIICGNTLENQKVVGIVNGVTQAIEKFIQNAGLFIDGKKSMGNCQTDMKSIIEILLKQMTDLKTCNVLQGMNIEWFTQEQMKITNLLMVLNIEDVNYAKTINRFQSFHLEMLELIRDIVNRVQQINCLNGEKTTEKHTISITENTEKRFLYCPKPSQFERNKGLKGFEKQINGVGALRDNGRESMPRGNTHPTVKPIDLMRYLVKLITPKNGICLDPFCGSGTTLIGCKLELINFIGIDTNEDYCKIAEARVAAWNPEKYIPQTLFT